MKYPLSILLILLSAPSLVSAQEQAEDIETVVVTATRTSRAEDKVSAPVIVIDRATIERSMATDMADLLKFHAGLDIARNGGPGQLTSVFIRGTESNHTLVMIDGVKINPGTAGGAALQQINPEMVERIEIVKGPRSSLYGSEAIGGVINIITLRKAQTGMSASLGAGSYATRDGSFDGRISGDSGSMGASVSWMETDGFPVQTGTELDRGHDNRTANVFGELSLGAALLSVRHWEARGNTEYLDFFLAPLDQDFRNQATTMQVEAGLAGNWQTSVMLSRVVDELSQNQSSDFFITERDTLDWQNDFQAGEHLFTAGLYLSSEDTRALSYGTGYDESTDINAVYLQDQIQSGAHDLVAAWRHTDHESAGSHNTWNLDYGFSLTPALRLNAGAGTGFRAPNGSERYGYGGNPDLLSETSANLELGASYQLDPKQQVWIRAFDNEIDNLIDYVILDFNTFEGINQNVARARIRGIEAGYEYIGQDWRFRAEGISQDPEDRGTGETLLRRASESLSASLVRGLGSHELGLDMLSTGERSDYGFPSPTRLPGYTLFNLTARMSLGNSWWLQGKVENLLDKQYQTVAGYTTSGRGVYLSVNYRSL
ncbi:MAG: TonB-dependent receptor [Chromatiales bacterium]|nr:TonB-dependent receptor [Chromatiales bacterium]